MNYEYQMTLHFSTDLKLFRVMYNFNIFTFAVLIKFMFISDIDFGSSVKAVGDVTSTGGNLVLNTVADVVLDDFMAAAVTTDQDAAIRGGLELKRHLHVNDFTVEHLLNGRNITNVVKNGLLKNSTDSLNLSNVTVYGNVTFQVVSFENK